MSDLSRPVACTRMARRSSGLYLFVFLVALSSTPAVAQAPPVPDRREGESNEPVEGTDTGEETEEPVATDARIQRASSSLFNLLLPSQAVVRGASSPQMFPSVIGAPAPDEIKKYLADVNVYLGLAAEEEKSRAGFKGTFKFGANADDAGSNKQSKGNLEAGMAFGTYPHQLRFNVSGSVRYDNGKVSEDVTTMLVNYDYYTKPQHEIYSFFERFTDSFLSIDQRYEIGAGFKFELTDRAKYEGDGFFKAFSKFKYGAAPPNLRQCQEAYTKEGCEKFKKLLEARKNAKTALDTLDKFVDPAYKDTVQNLAKDVEKIPIDDIIEARRKEFTRLEVGFAVGALMEFENPAGLKRLVTSVDTAGVSTTEERTLDPGAAQRFRLSLRPSLKWRLGERTQVDLAAYYKPALDSPRKVNGERDYRIDASAAITWALTKPTASAKSPPKVFMSFDWRYDSVPPDPSSLLLSNESFAEAKSPAAEKLHRIFKLGVEVAL